MEAKMRAAAALVTVLCCGCNQQRLTPDSCVVHMSSTFAGTGSAQGQITVAKNGAPCGIAFVMNGPSGGGFVSDPGTHHGARTWVCVCPHVQRGGTDILLPQPGLYRTRSVRSWVQPRLYTDGRG